MSGVTLDWIQLAAVVGSLQGLLLAGVLVSQRANRTANRLLAVLMAAFTIYLASSVYFATGLFREYPHLFGISYLMPWVFGPLVYLYALAASDRAWRLGRIDLIHFAPVAIVFVVMSPWYFMSGAEKVALYDRLVAGDVPARMRAVDPTKYLSGIGYSIATVMYLRGHRRRIEENYSNVGRVNLRWLMWLAGAAGAIWLLATTLRITDVGQRLRDDHISLAIAVLIYTIGYLGLRQPEIFRYQTSEYAVPVKVELPPAAVAESTRYERSGLTDSEAEELIRALRRVMETDQPWKDSDLTLPDLAELVGSSPHKLSEVLNSQLSQTFYDFVNGYRVREVQRRIEIGDARHLKMLALALDAGFASKSTFNQVFKKHTSVTPSDFRARIETVT